MPVVLHRPVKMARRDCGIFVNRSACTSFLLDRRVNENLHSNLRLSNNRFVRPFRQCRCGCFGRHFWPIVDGRLRRYDLSALRSPWETRSTILPTARQRNPQRSFFCTFILFINSVLRQKSGDDQFTWSVVSSSSLFSSPLDVRSSR